MGNLSNPIANRTLASINQSETEAMNKVEEKKAKYEAAKNSYSLFADKLWFAERNLKSHRGESDYKNKYNNLKTKFSSSEIMVSVFRDSLQNSLSYYSKVSNSAFIANSVLG